MEVCRFWYIVHLFIQISLLVDMAANQDSLEDRLRDALLRNVTELNNYRKLYKQSQDENKSLRKICHDLEVQNKCLNNTNVDLYRRNCIKNNIIEQMESELAPLRIPKMRKSISHLKSRSQCRQRKTAYKNCLRRTINSFPDAISANVSLNIGDEWIEIRFSEKDLRSATIKYADPRSVAQDHPYSNSSDIVMEESNDTSDEESDSDSVIVLNGEISQKHKRKVAHVMDLHKISEKAYHELRMSCKGILPPLSNVRKERLLMSSEIPYIVSPTVRFYQ